MSPVARLKWSVFWGVDLQPCKTMTNTLAPACGACQLLYVTGFAKTQHNDTRTI